MGYGGFVFAGEIMFTNEFEYNATVTTVLDNKDSFEDITLAILDDFVCLQQYNEEEGMPDTIIISHEQWYELLTALKLPEGAFYINKERK